MARLLALFILVPIAELILLVEIGRRVGLPATLALIVFTGALGAFLARRQGLAVLAEIRAEMAAGRLPAGQLVDGALILAAAAVLMTPGVLTDVFGFFCLIPPGRRRLRAFLARRFEHSIRSGSATVSIDPTVDLGVDFGAGFGSRYPRVTRDVTPRPASVERLSDGID